MAEQFIDCLRDVINNSSDCYIQTENGTLGYKSSGSKLLDLNFSASSLRNASEEYIWEEFCEAFADDPTLSIAWLFFARDVRGGMGERRLFRIIFSNLCSEWSSLATALIPYVEKYGRFDDVISLLDGDKIGKTAKKAVLEYLSSKLMEDVANLPKKHAPVSLLAKWMPSENASSKLSRRLSYMIMEYMGISERQYRKILTSLRNRIGVVETMMSAGEWEKINYERVPSRAGMLYHDAFERHDRERYNEYLEDVKNGNAKINSSTLFPYEIVGRIRYEANCDALNAMWNALPNSEIPASTLVVVDGSGSMTSPVGNTHFLCLDVSHSMGIYFSERLTGPYRNKIITFSSKPQFVKFPEGASLNTKVKIIDKYNDCTNTDLERTFDLILRTAIENNLKQEELPANVLIISDMEFDMCIWGNRKALMETISDKFESNGYKLPRLIFWNVCSRTGAIPMRQNDNGVVLVSGFSPNVVSMIMSEKTDPYECLVETLTSERYQPIIEEVKRYGTIFKG